MQTPHVPLAQIKLLPSYKSIVVIVNTILLFLWMCVFEGLCVNNVGLPVYM